MIPNAPVVAAVGVVTVGVVAVEAVVGETVLSAKRINTHL